MLRSSDASLHRFAASGASEKGREKTCVIVCLCALCLAARFVALVIAPTHLISTMLHHHENLPESRAEQQSGLRVAPVWSCHPAGEPTEMLPGLC